MKQKTPLEEALEYLREVRYYDIVDFQYKSAISEAIKIAISSAEKREQDRIIQVISKYGFFNPNSKLIKEIKKLK